MVAIATEDDGFTIIELLSDWEIEVGDSISAAPVADVGSLSQFDAVYDAVRGSAFGKSPR